MRSLIATSGQELTFIKSEDKELYEAWEDRAFELQVANHELLGHGSGKLFTEDEQGKLNFDPSKASVHSCVVRSMMLRYL